MLAAAASLLLASVSATAHAATLQSLGTFSTPVFITSEPADPNRVLIAEKEGRIIRHTGSTTSVFLDITDIVDPLGEGGLLSIAFDPDFATSRLLYVFYTDTNGDIQIDEFEVSPVTGDVDESTGRAVLSIPHPNVYHNGGQLQFGPDGFLYISTGDGAIPKNAQDTGSLLGKILRIDPAQSGPDPYTVPPDNPFVDVAGADEIWSYGLRHPFRFSFDRSTGALLIPDVGGASREEIDFERQPNAGRQDNFGWPCREGFLVDDPVCAGASLTDPIHDYSHAGGNCSITGGYVVRDPALPELAGRYLYADFCLGELRSLVPGLPLASDDRCEGMTVQRPTSFGEDSSGRLYVASFEGEVFRIVPGESPCGEADGDGPGGGAPPEADPPGGGEPDPTPADGERPTLELFARERQQLDDDGKLVCRLVADEPSEAVVRLALVTGGRVLLRLEQKRLDLAAGEVERVRFKLDRKQRHSIRGKLRDGELEARFRARARDASANRSPRAEATSEVD